MKVRERRPDVWWARAFLFLVALPFLGISPYIGVVNNPNENVRTYMTMALVEDHTFKIDSVVQRFGWINDMARVPAHGKEPDHVYSLKGPAVSYAGVPFYWAFRKIAIWRKHPPPSETWKPDQRAWWLRASTFTLRLFVVQLPCFCFLVWFERYLRTVTSDLSLRLSAVAAAGLGTNYIAYAQAFVSHALVAVAAFLAFALTEIELRRMPQHRSMARAFWVGVFCGLVTMLEYSAFPISVILAVWGLSVFYRPTRLVSFALGGILNAAALMFFQWRSFGSPLTPGYKLAETQAFAIEHHKGLFGIVSPHWEPFKRLSIDPGFGFFGTSPYMWLGLLAVPLALVFTFGPPRIRRIRRRATLVWLVTMLSLWLVIGGYLQWRGGWTVGPRFFGAAPPFFAFGAACALEKLARRGPITRAVARGMAGGLAVASVITIGFVSIVYNTLPPDLLRPLAHFALPMARAGFVGHHVLEWVGLNSVVFWYIAAAALVGAPLVAVLARGKAHAWPYAAQLGVAALACWAGLRPQFAPPKPGEPLERFDLRGFVDVWEPHGRDRIASLRTEAERYGPRRPCLWYRLADLEESVGLVMDAVRDGKRSEAPRSRCPRRLLSF
jgi:hypothetical protein